MRKATTPEWQIHFAICDYLDIAARSDVIWLHPANGEKRSIKTAMRLKRMGVKAGAPDLIFVIGGRAAFMEIKSEKGALSDKQKEFREKCLLLNIPFETVRSVEEAAEVLSRWGVLRQFKKRERGALPCSKQNGPKIAS